MKNLLLVCAVCFSSVGFAQIMDVSSVNEIKIPKEVTSGLSTISPNGDYLLVTDFGKNGLQKIDLTSGQVSTITSAPGAGYDVRILNDGNTIIYRETSLTKDHLKRTSLKSTNITTGAKTTLVEPTRNLQGVTVKNGTVYSVNNGKIATKAFQPIKRLLHPLCQ